MKHERSGVIRALLVDDHETVRQGLRLLIDNQSDMRVVAEAGDGASAVERAETERPDVVVMDISMPGMNGLVATRMLKRVWPEAAIVILTRHSDDAYLKELLRAGAAGYVLKQSPPRELLQAIRAVSDGGHFLDSSITERITTGLLEKKEKGANHVVSLSDTESVVLQLIASGYGNKEIAGRLDLSVKTVEVHKANAMRKLNLRGRIDIVKYAVLQGWLHDP